jgi:hypothetical protein
MRPPGSTKPIIFSFILAIGITLTLPYVAFGAAHSFGGSRSFRAPGIIHRQPFFPRPFQPFGFLGGGGVSEQPVIIIQQFQPAAAVQTSEPAENRIYVQPRWVDGGYGVQVL